MTYLDICRRSGILISPEGLTSLCSRIWRVHSQTSCRQSFGPWPQLPAAIHLVHTCISSWWWFRSAKRRLQRELTCVRQISRQALVRVWMNGLNTGHYIYWRQSRNLGFSRNLGYEFILAETWLALPPLLNQMPFDGNRTLLECRARARLAPACGALFQWMRGGNH